MMPSNQNMGDENSVYFIDGNLLFKLKKTFMIMSDYDLWMTQAKQIPLKHIIWLESVSQNLRVWQ